MLASSLTLLFFTASALGGNIRIRENSDLGTISAVGQAQHVPEDSILQVRDRLDKRATLSSNFGASSLTGSITQCGTAQITLKGSGNVRPVSLVLLDSGRTPTSFKSGITTLDQAKALNPYGIISDSARDGQAFPFTVTVPSRYPFDVYGYFPNGTGKYLGVGTRRVGPPAEGAATCIPTCRRDMYLTANTCVKCTTTFGNGVLTCDANGAKTCASGYTIRGSGCVASSASTSAPASSRSTATQSTTTRTTTRATTTTTTTRTTTRTTTTTSPPSSTTSSASNAVKTLALNEHNRYRATRRATNPLIWDDTLAQAAQTWANRCVFEHSRGAVGNFGENLAASAGDPSQTIVDGIEMWEAEAPDFTCTTPVYSHFTCMSWRSTTRVGCAEATCDPGTIFDSKYGRAKFWVCEYNDEVPNSGSAQNYCANAGP